MTERNTGGGFSAVLEELAASRGYTLAGLAEEARRRGHDYTPDEIITGGRGGYGDAIDAVLRLDQGERERMARAYMGEWEERMRALKAGEPLPSPDKPTASPPKAPGLARYGGPEGKPNPRGDGGPRCCVSHPDAGGPCGEQAAVEVWALPFCGRHGEEAEAAALSELCEDARRGVEAIVEGERERWRRNSALLHLLRRTAREAQAEEEATAADHEEAMQRAYGPDLDPARTHRETLDYTPDAPEIGDPVLWWSETRRALCKAMREAYEGGLTLAADLEPLREQATAQELLALRAATEGMPA